jgi:hypothetical protein
MKFRGALCLKIIQKKVSKAAERVACLRSERVCPLSSGRKSRGGIASAPKRPGKEDAHLHCTIQGLCGFKRALKLLDRDGSATRSTARLEKLPPSRHPEDVILNEACAAPLSSETGFDFPGASAFMLGHPCVKKYQISKKNGSKTCEIAGKIDRHLALGAKRAVGALLPHKK